MRGRIADNQAYVSHYITNINKKSKDSTRLKISEVGTGLATKDNVNTTIRRSNMTAKRRRRHFTQEFKNSVVDKINQGILRTDNVRDEDGRPIERVVVQRWVHEAFVSGYSRPDLLAPAPEKKATKNGESVENLKKLLKDYAMTTAELELELKLYRSQYLDNTSSKAKKGQK